MAETESPAASSGLRMLIDYGPLVVFFLANALIPGDQLSRVFGATAAFMVAIAASMVLARWKLGRISPMLWVSGALVLVFGSLTLYFHDETFIKVKPTIVYAMFAAVLFYGLITGRPVLQALLESAYPGLSARGWRLLTMNWAVYFVAMAVLNEVVWRTQSWDFWVAFKLWGVAPLTIVFALANVPMLLRHGLKTQQDAPVPPEG